MSFGVARFARIASQWGWGTTVLIAVGVTSMSGVRANLPVAAVTERDHRSSSPHLRGYGSSKSRFHRGVDERSQAQELTGVTVCAHRIAGAVVMPSSASRVGQHCTCTR